MTCKKEVFARIDGKGRVTLPKSIREALGLKAGDTLFFKYDSKNGRVQIAPTVSPFDILAEHAIEEYKQKRTKTVEEYVDKKLGDDRNDKRCV